MGEMIELLGNENPNAILMAMLGADFEIAAIDDEAMTVTRVEAMTERVLEAVCDREWPAVQYLMAVMHSNRHHVNGRYLLAHARTALDMPLSDALDLIEAMLREGKDADANSELDELLEGGEITQVGEGEGARTMVRKEIDGKKVTMPVGVPKASLKELAALRATPGVPRERTD